MVEILCGEDWEHSEDISKVPKEHWKWFLGAHVGTVSMRKIAGKARRLLANLRVLRDQKGWKHIGLNDWGQTLNWFGLTPKQWEWLEAGEPVLTDNDSVEQGIEKGRAQQAAQMVIDGEAETLQEAADKFGISRQAVHEAKGKLSSKLSGSEPLLDSHPPDHLKGNTDRADWHRLSPDGQERVRNKEPIHRVATQEGIRKRLSPLEQAQKAFRRLTREDRDAFDLWRNEQPL